MSCKLVSGGKPRFHLSAQLTKRASPLTGPSSTHLSFTGKPISSKPLRLRLRRPRISVSAFYTPTVEEATRESFYDLLGIPESGSFSEIKKAYKQLARKYHPDVSPPERTEEYTRRFILVQEAYETLSDPETRASYDTYLARGLHLAFSARRRSGEMQSAETGEWRVKWESQLNDLKRRSTNRDSRGTRSTTWGARMRRKRNDIFDLGSI